PAEMVWHRRDASAGFVYYPHYTLLEFGSEGKNTILAGHSAGQPSGPGSFLVCQILVQRELMAEARQRSGRDDGNLGHIVLCRAFALHLEGDHGYLCSQSML
ncbi:unnamed protein product, partial [Ostreobium quekettii]